MSRVGEIRSALTLFNSEDIVNERSKLMINYAEKFRERGLEPLALITNHKQKVPCIDKEGYKYYLNYHDHIADSRTKEFDKWTKKNPFKSYNMRLYATTV